MPPQRTTKSSNASGGAYPRPAKKVKPALPVEEQLQKRWKSMKDQIGNGYHENALKTCKKALALDAQNELANQTYIQLLLTLDRYNDALEYIQEDEDRSNKWKIERCYALYKVGREAEAGELLAALREGGMDLDNDEERVRTLDVLEAQIRYRLEEFSDSRDIYDDLLATVDNDSPEHADLTTNLSACNAHLDFIASIPSRLGELSSTNGKDRLPPIDVLESTPVSTLISTHPSYRTRTTTVPSAQSTTKPPMPGTTSTATKKLPSKSKSKKGKKTSETKKTKTPRLPRSIAALPEGQRPAPDPERWLPKRERKGYAEVLAQKEKEKEKRRLKARKKLEASMTQGSAAADSRTESPAPTKTNGGNAGSGQKKQQKKKGGKR